MSSRSNFDHRNWAAFTGRSSDDPQLDSVRHCIQGKRVLITGAGGFIGSALARRLAQLGPCELILLDQSEIGLYQLDLDLRAADTRPVTQLVVGSVCDLALVQKIFSVNRPDIVFHAAACKHVPLMELNPFTAAATNILGTRVITEASSAAGSEQCILLSTDKSVDPGSIMGATKRVAELILLASARQTDTPTQRKALRLGNILGSSGSVVPLFVDQISRGGPVTITHPEATRYFLSVEDAVHHLLSALTVKTSPAILAPEMGAPHSICELAGFLISQEPHPHPEIEMVFTGLRPGDKLTENMTSSRETLVPAVNGLRVVQSAELRVPNLPLCIEEVDRAIKTRDLTRLIEAIQTAVPSYHPSDLLRSTLTSALGGKRS